MADNDFNAYNLNQNSGCFKEAVCIDAFRVYDSCADKDCLEDLRVYFTESGQRVISTACNVRIRDIDVITVYLDLEPVPFNKGFYSVDMTFFFEVKLDVFLAPAAVPVSICGLSIFNKKVILYGSEGNVKIFSSDFALDEADKQNTSVRNLPKATVQVAEPIGLSAKICEVSKCCKDCCREPECRIPECICRRFGGDFETDLSSGSSSNKAVYITMGIFTIVQIERNVQMMIPAYDFCIPNKECVTTSDNPCELFNKLDFPTDEFFPPRATDNQRDDHGCGCGCND